MQKKRGNMSMVKNERFKIIKGEDNLKFISFIQRLLNTFFV